MASFLILLGAAAALEALYSLWAGRAYNSQFVPGEGSPADWEPPATLVLPCRGVDAGLQDALESLATQHYRDYELLLVADSERDPVAGLLQQIQARYPGRTRLLWAGRTAGRSQKVHNLLLALESLRSGDEVVVFADSDIEPTRDWLRTLVAPLSSPEVGISTGFRWYQPRDNSLAAHCRSLWNAGGASLMARGGSPFAWGGAMALRVETIRDVDLADRWKGVVSDDFTASECVRRAGLKIRFEPGCLSVSRESCSWSELLRWVFRQLAITRVYRPGLWKLALLNHSLSVVVFWGALGLAAVPFFGGSAPAGTPTFVGLGLLWYGLGATKSALRLRAVRRVVPNPAGSRLGVLVHVLGAPIASLISLTGLLASGLRRDISWRGIRYRMVSKSETEVLAVGDPPVARDRSSVL